MVFDRSFWVGPYLLGLFTISYLGSFGGKGYITFGWDFLVIGIFSIVILMLAVMTRRGVVMQEQYQVYRKEAFSDDLKLCAAKA